MARRSWKRYVYASPVFDALCDLATYSFTPPKSVAQEWHVLTPSQYIAHRAQREAQVLSTLRTENGGRGLTSMSIVKVVYKDYPESLHIPAEGGVRQVLEKLEKEGRVGRRDEDGDEIWTLKAETGAGRL